MSNGLASKVMARRSRSVVKAAGNREKWDTAMRTQAERRSSPSSQIRHRRVWLSTPSIRMRDMDEYSHGQILPP